MSHFIIWNSYDFSIYSPVRTMGPHKLAHYLTKYGYKVKVIDFCSLLTTKQLISLTERYITSETIAIGASNTFWNSDNTAKFDEPMWASRARGILEIKYPKLNWVLGGSRTAFSNTRFKWTRFSGYAENETLKFLDEKTNNTVSRIAFDIKDCDHHYLDGNLIRPEEVLGLELSRGCIFKCTFCRYPLIGKAKNTYIRDSKLIEQELLFNYEKFGTTRYYIMDDTVNESEEKITALAEIAARLPFKLEWVGYVRLDLIANKPHTAEILKQSGLRNAFFGVESFNKKASKIVNKGWHGEKAKDYLLELREVWNNSIGWQLAFIVGLTGETEQDLDETQQWCIDNKMHSWYWNALSISKNPNLVWKSYFDTHYEEFGYKFSTSDDYYWENDLWNSHTAMSKANQLTADMQSYNKSGPWLSGEIATVGYHFDDFMYKYKHDINFEELKQKTQLLVQDYHNQLLL